MIASVGRIASIQSVQLPAAPSSDRRDNLPACGPRRERTTLLLPRAGIMEAHIDTDADELVSAHARTKAVGVEPREDKPELLQRGDALGRYVVLRKLGAGGMGTVYLGYDPELDRKVERPEARRAVRIASYLDPVEVCLDPVVLQRLPMPPLEQRDDIRSLRTQLTEVERAQHQGRFADALALATPARALAEALAWPPVLALARFIEGRSLYLTGHFAEADIVLTRAYFEAHDAGAIEVAFRAARTLMGALDIWADAVGWTRPVRPIARR